MLESVTDADWAGCKASRRSKSSVHLYCAGGLLASYVRSQRSIALSSGESEYIAMVSGATELVYLKECLVYLSRGRFEVEAIMRSDSAAARGISQRMGCGRVRHLDCALMWVQNAIKEKALKAGPIAGVRNPADVGTKALSGHFASATCAWVRWSRHQRGLEPCYGVEPGRRSCSFLDFVMRYSCFGSLLLDWCSMDLFPSFPNFDEQQVKSQKPEVGCQADRGMSPSEMKFADDHMERCEFLTRAVREEHRVVEQCEQALRDVRSENRRRDSQGEG